MPCRRPPQALRDWIDARNRHRKLDNHRQEPWKLPLPAFIEELYAKRFGKRRPNVVTSIGERLMRMAKKKSAREARGFPRASNS